MAAVVKCKPGKGSGGQEHLIESEKKRERTPPFIPEDTNSIC